MEVGLREWLILGAIIVIILIVVDGWRRMRAQSNTLKIDIDDKLSELGNDEYNPELPLGSARVFKAKDDADNKVEEKVEGNVAERVEESIGVASIEVASDTRSNSFDEHTAPATITENKLENSSHSPDLTSSNKQPQTTDFCDDGLSAVKVSSSAKKTRVEPVFEESRFESDDSTSNDPLEVSSLAEPAAKEPVEAINTPEPDDVELSAVNQELDQNLDQQTKDTNELRLSSEDSLIVPDILKKSVDQFSKLENRATESIENSQIDAQAPVEDIETQTAVSEDNLEQEKAAKENTDNIVNNLLTTLAQSKKVASESEPDALNALESHYQERIRKEENSVLVVDKFEQLLAEKTANSNYEVAEITPVDDSSASSNQEHSVHSIEENHQIDVQEEIVEETVIEEAIIEGPITQEPVIEQACEIEASDTSSVDVETTSSDELDAIAAKQKEIDALKAKLEELSAQEIAKSQALKEAELRSIEATPIESANDVDLAVTTVIDDEVNLEDLANEITKLPEDLDIEPLAEFLNDDVVVEEEVELDPLMDGFNDEAASQELVSQFEEDLEEDQQAVSNELDMPITEILKKQQAYSNSSAAESSEEDTEPDEEDPLLEENQLPESLLSGANFETEQVDELDPEQDEVLDESDNLGFNAFDQGEMSDPLMDDYVEESAQTENLEESQEVTKAHQQKSFFDDHDEEAQATPVLADAVQPLSVSDKKARKAISNVDDPNAVLIVTVVAKEHYLNGAALRRVVEACGMEFGDMEVFHRFEDGADSGAVQFSMANAINPGTFDIEQMDETATPGVSFFMSMDEPADAKKALECMLATAETVALHLHGDLLDDDRSVLRPQTKEHYRERVRIHTMNKLRKRAQ